MSFRQAGYLPDRVGTGRGSPRSVPSLYVRRELYGELEPDECIPCGPGMKGRRTADTLAGRFETMVMIRYETGAGTEYAAADRLAIARVTGRNL